MTRGMQRFLFQFSGIGYYTFNTDHPECVFDPFVVEIVMKPRWYLEPNKIKAIKHHLKDKYGKDFILNGVEDLVVEWIPEGTKFRIHEYDGSEYIEIMHEIDWLEAQHHALFDLVCVVCYHACRRTGFVELVGRRP